MFGLRLAKRVVRCAVLKVRRCEMRSRIGERARRYVVLMIPKVVGVPAHAIVVMLIIHVVLVSTVHRALKHLTQSRLLRLERLVRSAIEQVVILPVAGMIVHAAGVGIVRGRIGARRAVWRGRVGVGVVESTAVIVDR